MPRSSGQACSRSSLQGWWAVQLRPRGSSETELGKKRALEAWAVLSLLCFAPGLWGRCGPCPPGQDTSMSQVLTFVHLVPVPVGREGKQPGAGRGKASRWPWVTPQMLSWGGAGNSQLPLAPSQPTSSPPLPLPCLPSAPPGPSSAPLLTPADSSLSMFGRWFPNSWELGSCLFLDPSLD